MGKAKGPPATVDPRLEAERAKAQEEKYRTIQENLRAPTAALVRLYGTRRVMAGASGSPAILTGA